MSYDVIVVGAGSAGCALAHRLSADPACSVALIEAGGADDHPDIAAPTEYFNLWGSDVDWKYASSPQAGTAGRVHQLPRGRVLGGTSSINGMVYLRGARDDFDRWAAGGCPGWEWASVLAAYEAMEAMLEPAVLAEINPLSDVFIEAAAQVGYARNPSFDSGTLDGAGYNRSSIRRGRRTSSYQAFIAPFADRPNLHVLSSTAVERLIVDATGAVSGVVVHPYGGGASERLPAGEVVLCAGAFDTPRLLLHSGIGPAGQLRAAGIEPIVDLPVGQNLIDHLLIGVVYTSTRPISMLNSMVTESCGFGRSSIANRDAPDIEISFAKEPNFAPLATDGRPRYTIIPGITQPRSRGTVSVRSADPSDPLVIDPGFLRDPDDLRMLIDGIRMTREIGAAPAFEEWSAGEYFPGVACESDADLTAYIEGSVSTWFHPVGTCRMGTGDDAVVTPGLRVRGTTGLAVADASVMPEIVSVNTNAASMMIGWRAGDLLSA